LQKVLTYIAHLVEQFASNELVTGSNPVVLLLRQGTCNSYASPHSVGREGLFCCPEQRSPRNIDPVAQFLDRATVDHNGVLEVSTVGLDDLLRADVILVARHQYACQANRPGLLQSQA